MRRRGHVRLAQARSEADLVGEGPRLGPPTPERLEEVVGRLGLSGFERGDFVVVGRAFACGLTTDWLPLALARAGAGGLLAQAALPALRESAALAGVPTLELGATVSQLEDGEDLVVDFGTGTLESVTRRRVHLVPAMRPDDLETTVAAPALAWYGLAAPATDPDVYEPAPAPKPGASPARGQTTLL